MGMRRMSFKIVRNDITKMNTQAIVNTANEHATVDTGCDSAIYNAAGYSELLTYRKENIGEVPEGEVFITPGFNLKAEYIIHAVSPLYINGDQGEEEKLRSCYQKSLNLALEHSITSIAFPLISTGSFGYPKEEGMRIAVDEINAFLLKHDMEIYLVVFDEKTTTLGGKIYPDLEQYIDKNYVEEKQKEEYWGLNDVSMSFQKDSMESGIDGTISRDKKRRLGSIFGKNLKSSDRRDYSAGNISAPRRREESADELSMNMMGTAGTMPTSFDAAKKPDIIASSMKPDTEDNLIEENEFCEELAVSEAADEYIDFELEHASKLEERMKHLSDTFSQYLLYLIQDKKMENADVYKRAIVDKKTFSKIKNNVNYHPQKLTALCLCVGARLNLDESRDLLARAGYALSPCDMTDIIFSYFIENEIYDMIELDIQLEEHGLPCIIS